MFRMLGMIKHTALYGQNPDIRYAYVCAVYIRNRINTDGPALHIRVRHLRVRDAVEMEKIAIEWICTKFMLADGVAKVCLDLHGRI